jgi:hypothetical protein
MVIMSMHHQVIILLTVGQKLKVSVNLEVMWVMETLMDPLCIVDLNRH